MVFLAVYTTSAVGDRGVGTVWVCRYTTLAASLISRRPALVEVRLVYFINGVRLECGVTYVALTVNPKYKLIIVCRNRVMAKVTWYCSAL